MCIETEIASVSRLVRMVKPGDLANSLFLAGIR
jgi:hypothetical protein